MANTGSIVQHSHGQQSIKIPAGNSRRAHLETLAVGLGIAYYNVDKEIEAISACRHMLALNPVSVIANYHLGVNYASIGKYEEAIAKFKRILEVCPDDHQAAKQDDRGWFRNESLSQAHWQFCQKRLA